MAYKFETQSGAIYLVRDGRITREGDTLDWNADGIVNEPFRFVGLPPTIGQEFHFRLPGRPGLVPVGWHIGTSTVVDRWEVDANGEMTSDALLDRLGFDGAINAAWDEYERAGQYVEPTADVPDPNPAWVADEDEVDALFALANEARQIVQARQARLAALVALG